MVFDGATFLIFFAIFFVIYHSVWRSFQLQNLVALVGSCVFYGWWNWRLLGLLLVSAGIDYLAGLALGLPLSLRSRRGVFIAAMCANLGILFFFKYFDFFAQSLSLVLGTLGVHVSLPVLHLALPIGISFYTFQSMSYTIDIYRREIVPERNPVTYFTFVSFFPHMVAGPIQRAHHLLGQLNQPRRLTAGGVREATWLLVYGYFMKEVVADGASSFANPAFTVDQRSGWMTVLGTLAFGIQVYCDFNAYSMIARGLGRLLGVEFIWNFNQPYFATSVQDFWRRWHISLSTWLRDYLYIGLGGNRLGGARTYANLILTMLLGGLWHGAAWTFVVWGLLHGIALAVERKIRELRGANSKGAPPALAWASTMSVVFIGWFFFRCSSMEMVLAMIRALGDMSWEHKHTLVLTSLAVLASPVVAIELWQFRAKSLLAPLSLSGPAMALLNGTMLAFTVAMFSRFHYAFIYFQF